MNLQATASIGTVVAIVDERRHDAALDVMTRLAARSAVRPIVISLGSRREPPIERRDRAFSLRGLVPPYLNNAVASLRLSSLPALGWWRSAETEGLDDLAVLVDRLVLDAEDPLPAWRLLPRLAAQTAVTDLRWTRLTRWRELLAQFFDLEEVRRRMATIEVLESRGQDRHEAALIAGWIRARMPGAGTLALRHEAAAGGRIERVLLRGPGGTLSIGRVPNAACVQTAAQFDGIGGSRVVPLADPAVDRLLVDELRLRSRDALFEDAAGEALQL